MLAILQTSPSSDTCQICYRLKNIRLGDRRIRNLPQTQRTHPGQATCFPLFSPEADLIELFEVIVDREMNSLQTCSLQAVRSLVMNQLRTFQVGNLVQRIRICFDDFGKKSIRRTRIHISDVDFG